jgi:hypothetical protein
MLGNRVENDMKQITQYCINQRGIKIQRQMVVSKDIVIAVITEISSAQDEKNSASSIQKNSHSWHKD